MTPLTLMYLRYSWRQRMQSKYPRHKLANDGVRLGAGQLVMTPKLGEAEAVAWFGEMEEIGLVENADQFKRDLVVERNASNPNRLDLLLPPDLINSLITTAAQFQFRS
jgi:phage tail sheath gpL-like